VLRANGVLFPRPSGGTRWLCGQFSLALHRPPLRPRCPIRAPPLTHDHGDLVAARRWDAGSLEPSFRRSPASAAIRRMQAPSPCNAYSVARFPSPLIGPGTPHALAETAGTDVRGGGWTSCPASLSHLASSADNGETGGGTAANPRRESTRPDATQPMEAVRLMQPIPGPRALQAPAEDPAATPRGTPS